MTTERHQLWLGDGRGGFTDASDQLPRRSQGNALAVGDVNGDRDLIVGAITVPGFVPQQARAWINDGKGRFTDATATAMPQATVGRSWSMATGDLDGDGRPDVFIGGWATQARLLLSGPAPAR